MMVKWLLKKSINIFIEVRKCFFFYGYFFLYWLFIVRYLFVFLRYCYYLILLYVWIFMRMGGIFFKRLGSFDIYEEVIWGLNFYDGMNGFVFD